MRRNCNHLDHARLLAEKDGEGKALQAQPAQPRRSSDGKPVGCFANVPERGGYLGEVARAKAGLSCLVVRNLLQVLGFRPRKKRNPHFSKACALR